MALRLASGGHGHDRPLHWLSSHASTRSATPATSSGNARARDWPPARHSGYHLDPRPTPGRVLAPRSPGCAASARPEPYQHQVHRYQTRQGGQIGVGVRHRPVRSGAAPRLRPRFPEAVGVLPRVSGRSDCLYVITPTRSPRPAHQPLYERRLTLLGSLPLPGWWRLLVSHSLSQHPPVGAHAHGPAGLSLARQRRSNAAEPLRSPTRPF